jgi:two-component system sensor histidine kinase/response regulator
VSEGQSRSPLEREGDLTPPPASVLLVDDQPHNLLALEAMLGDLGLRLVHAGSGEEALKRVLEQEFAVILLDVRMPGMDGFETAARIRERERSRHTPIIFVTAIGRDEVQVFRGYEVGAVDYLFKPLAPEILRAKVGVFVDLHRKTEQIRHQAGQLEAMNRELEAFSYSVSHDLRAPLRRIRGSSEILLESWGERLDAEGREWLQRLSEESERMLQLIDGLLDLARVARTDIRREPVDLSAIAEGIAAELRRADPQRPVEFAIAPGLVAEGDEPLLRNVLENLMGNAWKFTSKAAHPRIEVGILRAAEGTRAHQSAGLPAEAHARGNGRGGERVYFVRDNGAGFDMRHVGKLFTAFQRLHSAHEFTGTGVGLATVQRIVNRHGGRIWADAEVGHGATFYFTL